MFDINIDISGVMAPQASLASFAAVILLLAPAVAAQGLNPNDYICPAGYKTINRQYISQEFFPFVECVIDPCMRMYAEQVIDAN